MATTREPDNNIRDLSINVGLDTLSLMYLQLLWVIMVLLFGMEFICGKKKGE
ncbi:hypothetical protein [Maribacter thermophilus]|uniref:hypothetical protein n=1 Tax=Maribacter thermophilus TaxID=1197874 RepID=UPI000ABFCBD4|nr:hypothetical protein [Maribacter thermophilus]